MRNKKIAWLLILLLSVSFQLTAQFTEKNDPQKTKDGSGNLDGITIEKTEFTTSRLEDIEELTDYQKKLQVAIESRSIVEADVFKNKALVVMTNEIARAKKNLKELKAGDTKHLEEYQKEHAPNYPVYVDLEIQKLTNRINYEVQVYKAFKSKDLAKLTSDRELSMAVGYVNGFKRSMERNLRYESDEKTIVIPKGEDTKLGGNKTDGPGIITKKGSKETIDSGDPRLQSWLDSKKQRKTDFQNHQTDFEKYAGKNNDNMARRSYQSMVQLMMDEINSSNWLIGQVGMGNIKKGSYDTNALAGTMEKQQAILNEAQKIKVSTPDDLKANKGTAIELINKFSNTMN